MFQINAVPTLHFGPDLQCCEGNKRRGKSASLVFTKASLSQLLTTQREQCGGSSQVSVIRSRRSCIWAGGSGFPINPRRSLCWLGCLLSPTALGMLLESSRLALTSEQLPHRTQYSLANQAMSPSSTPPSTLNTHAKRVLGKPGILSTLYRGTHFSPAGLDTTRM